MDSGASEDFKTIRKEKGGKEAEKEKDAEKGKLLQAEQGGSKDNSKIQYRRFNYRLRVIGFLITEGPGDLLIELSLGQIKTQKLILQKILLVLLLPTRPTRLSFRIRILLLISS